MSNLEKIIEAYRPYFDSYYTAENNHTFIFDGILVAEDDYYYSMRSMKDNTVRLLSCATSIEFYGFEKV